MMKQLKEKDKENKDKRQIIYERYQCFKECFDAANKKWEEEVQHDKPSKEHNEVSDKDEEDEEDKEDEEEAKEKKKVESELIEYIKNNYGCKEGFSLQPKPTQ